eukprot:Opistho-2@72277
MESGSGASIGRSLSPSFHSEIAESMSELEITDMEAGVDGDAGTVSITVDNTDAESALNYSTDSDSLPYLADSSFDENSARTCWVCFSGDEDDAGQLLWTQPCKCRGTTRWVHQACIQRWIDVKQGGATTAKVFCPQCRTEYVIECPEAGVFVLSMDLFDKIVNALSPFAALGVICSSVYVSALTYGGFTLCQVMGMEEGLQLMHRMEPVVLLASLPMIPFALVIPRFLRPTISISFGTQHDADGARHDDNPRADGANDGTAVDDARLAEAMVEGGVAQESDTPGAADVVERMPVSRAVVGALLLPSIAATLGQLFFRGRLASNFQRSIMGGLLFVVFKGTIRMYYKKQQRFLKTHRRVLDYVL